MRQLFVHSPREHSEAVVAAARSHGAVNLARWRVDDGEREGDLVLVHIGNAEVEGLLARLSELSGIRTSFTPTGVLTLHPPSARTPAQVHEVEMRSPIEVFLAGLQSIGSWRGFLAYAAASGAIVWVGLYTNTTYLLVAAMLIAPFGGPAMNAAIATARGDRTLFGRSTLRYVVGLAAAIAVAALLTLIFQQDAASRLALVTSEVSAVSVLLPLAAGAAGATQLIQSDRNSLVTGAAIGMLVAASLAPPAGITGVALALGRGDLIQSSAFLLLLQFVGINLAAALVFRRRGLTERGTLYDRGDRRIFAVITGLTAAALAGMLAWQFSDAPALQRSSIAQRASEAIEERLRGDDSAHLVRAEVTLPRAGIPGQDTLLCVLYVQRSSAAPPPGELRVALTAEVQSLLLAQGFGVTPLVAVHVLDPPR